MKRSNGLVANIFTGRDYSQRGTNFTLCYLLKSEEAGKQIVLILDGPVAGKAEALPQPQHRSEARDRPPRRLEGLKAAYLWHVLLYAEMVALDALLEMLGDIVDRMWMQEPVID